MFKKVINFNNKLNDTLNIYHSIGKISKPLYNYILILLSFLIITSCFTVLYTVKNNDNSNTDLYINVGLPIIIYGTICPVISTVISFCFQKFLINIVNFQINKINKVYFISFFAFLVIVYFTFINIYISILLSTGYTIYYYYNYYNNNIVCKIESIEKCIDKNNNKEFYRYNIELKSNNNTQIVKKRFNDFKKIYDNLKDVKLPTNSWYFPPMNILEATKRGKQLNSYINNIIDDENINYLLEDNLDSSQDIIVLEDIKLNNKNINLNDNLKNKINNLFNCNIDNIFVYYELNYYLNKKKRFFVIYDNKLIKLKYNKQKDIFIIKLIIEINNINKLIKGVISNTNYFNNNNILEIQYKDNNKLLLISYLNSEDNNIYNINNLYNFLLKNINHEISVIIDNKYILNTGIGLCEDIFNHKNVTLIKHMFS